ncbi:MAG TPA: hypothetical protein VHG08_08160 [Longimicrobium sp.]|nr:hypothetical protein [Longimicrobium sp.]
MWTRAVIPALLLAAAACTPPPRTDPGAGSVRVALVDSIPFRTELEEGFLRRVEVRSPGGVDTIRFVLTHSVPLVLADGTVLGFTFSGTELRSAFTWHPAGKQLRLIALPEDADLVFTIPAFSADGRYLAYVAYQQGFGRGMVRRGASGYVVVRTDSVEVPATDAAMNFARWTGPEAFEILLDVSETGWHRFSGTVSSGVTRVDTVVPPLPPGP